MEFWLLTDNGYWVSISHSEAQIMRELYPKAEIVEGDYYPENRTKMIYG